MNSLITEVSEISQYINLDRLRAENGDLKYDHYIAYPSDSYIPIEYQSQMKHIFDISYSVNYDTKAISISGYNDHEMGFLLKLTVPNCHVIGQRNILTD